MRDSVRMAVSDLGPELVARAAARRGLRKALRAAPGWTFRRLHAWPPGETPPWGGARSAFVLSFDCETERDAEVQPWLLSALQKRGLQASFAVIGALAEKAPDVYRRTLAEGHEILNHGYSEHTDLRADGSYESTLYYNDLTAKEVASEVGRCDEVLRGLLGANCAGFRVPHFGTFQSPDQVRTVHEVISRLGYHYSTSTTAAAARRAGVFGSGHGVVELPIASPVRNPGTAFDSWTLVKSRGASYEAGTLLQAWKRLLRETRRARRPVFVSVYFDPAHLAALPEFESCLDELAMLGRDVWTGTYADAAGPH